MAEENNQDLMSSYMQTQVAEQSSNSSKSETEKPKKNALEKARDEEKKKEEKELEEAKKNSAYNASKYRGAQANMMLARSRNMIYAIPFIVLGILVVLFVVKNGGSWVQGGTQFLVRKVQGGK